MTRRQSLGSAAATALSLAANAQDGNALVIDPKPLFPISPYLYMQFMEPLGVTDSSVEAAWDHDKDTWREDFVRATRDLAPGAMRWGGIYIRYYKWREGVGPVAKRPPHRNYQWGGWETNRVGTAEFVDFCRQVGAAPLMCVNFLSDGHKRFAGTREGNRTGDAKEAADWVSYCNDADHPLRREHGHRDPLPIKLWQLGNETSYGNEGFPRDEAIRHTIDFAKAMRARDQSIELIGWGDRGNEVELWAPEMIRRTGEHLNYVAIHMMGQSPRRKETVLAGTRYQTNIAQAWEELQELAGRVEQRTRQIVDVVRSESKRVGVAITEGHLSLQPHNANPILLEWLSATYHARSMNTYQRHGEHVRISTCADFNGSRWTVSAVMLPVPRGNSFLTPAGSVARLFRKVNGTHGASVLRVPSGVDVAASISGNKAFLHLANLQWNRPAQIAVVVEGRQIAGGRAWTIAPQDVRESVSPQNPDAFVPVESALPADGKWSLPPAGVAAVELDLG